MKEIIIDDNGNRFDLASDVYQPGKFSVNDLVVSGIGAAIRAGRTDWEF